MCLKTPTPAEVIFSIAGIGKLCRSLRYLSVTVDQINALVRRLLPLFSFFLKNKNPTSLHRADRAHQDISKLFAAGTDLFPLLETAHFNTQCTKAVFVNAKTECLDAQKRHLRAATSHNPNLGNLQFGNVYWTKDVVGWDVEVKSDAACRGHVFNRQFIVLFNKVLLFLEHKFLADYR